MYKKIKMWYDHGFWNEKMVRNAVNKGILTKEQADSIIKE